MTKNKAVRIVGSLLPLLLLASSPADAPQSQVLTLISPNEEQSGYFSHVAGTGDVNRDGFSDVIVGAIHEDPGTSPDNAGRAYVFGGPDGNLLFELASPNEQEGGEFGGSVAGAGDVNGDEFDDVIVGAKFEDPGTSPRSAGRAYVFSGKDGGLLWELASPNEQTAGEFGWAVGGAGDIDKDGFADVIVATPVEDVGGRAYVFSGKDGGLLFELTSANAEDSGWFGYTVAGVADANGDGFDDVVVGAPQENPPGSPDEAGRAYVFSGQDGSLLFELVSPNEKYHGHFGHSVAGAGDTNQDGFADVMVGAYAEQPEGSPQIAGRAYVFSGEDGGLMYELVSPNEQALGGFGFSVAGAGDVNKDGFADLAVSTPFEDHASGPEDAGRGYVFSGRDARLLFQLVSLNEEQDGWFGMSNDGAGDFNQDGFADVIVGAQLEQLGGRVYIFLLPHTFRINSGGPNYTDIHGSTFVADLAYAPGGFGHVGGIERHFDQPIGGTDDDPLYQNVRVGRGGDSDGIFSYRFDVAPGLYDVTLYLMAPALDGPGNVVMDVKAEEDVVFDDLDVTAEAGGEYQALVKTFAVDVTDGTLDLRFRAENKAAVVSAIAVTAQAQALGRGERRRLRGR